MFEGIEPAAKPSPKTSRQAIFLLATGLAAVLFTGASSLLNDPDTQWHIAVGHLMWVTGAVPQVDTLSYTFAGTPWLAKEWLSQLVLSAAFSMLGWWGVAALAACTTAASFARLFGWLLGRVRWSLALGLTLLAVQLAAPSFLARPHILVLPVVLAWMIELVSARERDRAPAWWVLGLMVLWANMHASYPIGFVLAFLLAYEAVIASPPSERRETVRDWALFLGGSVLAACISPYGYKTFLVVLALSQTSETMNYIGEWQPIGLDTQGVIAVLVVVLAMAALQRHPRQNMVRSVAVLLLGTMMIRHGRFALLFAVLTPVLIADPIARAFRGCGAVSFRVPRPGLALGSFLSTMVLIAGTASPAPDPAVAPMAALRFAEARGLTGRVYNDYDYGGFLILNGVKTFIDGRSDQLFTGGFTSRLNAALAHRDSMDFAAILDRQRVTWALVKAGSEDARHLSGMEGWTKLFADPEAVVFARTTTTSLSSSL